MVGRSALVSGLSGPLLDLDATQARLFAGGPAGERAVGDHHRLPGVVRHRDEAERGLGLLLATHASLGTGAGRPPRGPPPPPPPAAPPPPRGARPRRGGGRG